MLKTLLPCLIVAASLLPMPLVADSPAPATQGQSHQAPKPPQPQPPPPQSQQSPHQAATPDAKGGSVQDESRYLRVGVAVNIVLTLATLAIAVAGIVQARAAKESADATIAAAQFTEKTVRSSEGAEVLLDRAYFVVSTTGNLDEHAWLRLRFMNFGRTLAANVILDAHMLIAKNGSNTLAAKVAFQRGTLAAGQACRVDLQKLNEAFMFGVPARVLQGEGQLQFYATASYEDVFGGTHLRQFLGSYNPRTRTVSIDRTS